MNKKTIGLIYGGKSSEHEVSLRTAFSLLNALDYTQYNVIPFYIDLEGNWHKGNQLLAAPSELNVLRLQTVGEPVNLFALNSQIDVAFPVIHGPFGEDGTLQGLLEMMDVPYVGCGVLASSAGMDKVLMKNIFQAAGIPQCNYLHYTRDAIAANENVILDEIETTLGFPCFIKPANLGSSVGITKAVDRDTLREGLIVASRFDRRIIIEENVEGREIEIGVLGNDQLRTSAIGEIFTGGNFYDYTAKYKNNETKLQIPAEIPAEIEEEMATLAKKAFAALDGSGLSRLDFFYNEKTNQLLLNEINTMPGFTAFSMYPLLFKEVGLPYANLIEELISLAILRYNEKKKNQIIAEDFKQ